MSFSMSKSTFSTHSYRKVTTLELEPVNVEEIKNSPSKPDITKDEANAKVLCGFAFQLQKKMRGISFAWKQKSNDPTLWCYYDDKPYTMGYIGYGDFNTHVSPEEEEFIVYASTIENGKYSMYSNPYFMKKTIHLDKALKNACRHLRNPTPYELADLHSTDAKNKFDDVGREIEQRKSRIVRDLFDEDKLSVELRAIVESGYEFINREVSEKINEFIAVYDEDRDRTKKELNVYHVRVYMEDDIQMFDVVPIDNLHKGAGAVEGTLETYTSDTLPEEIMGKISVLTMVDVEQFVDDVGYKDKSGCFYVAR